MYGLLDRPKARDYKESVYNFGAALERWRQGAGLSQPELGAKLGVSQQAVSRWESGEAISLKHVVAIGRLLSVPPYELGVALLGEERADADLDLRSLAERLSRLEALRDPPDDQPHGQ